MATVQQVLTAAYAKSTKNRPGAIGTEATELVAVVGRALQGLFALGARVNPAFFGASAAVAYAAPGWARPADAEAVLRIESSAGQEVVVVPLEDRQAELGKPAVYQLGQVYRGAGNALDPTSGTLTFYYARRAQVPAALADPLDPLWPEAYLELLVLEVASALALKDGRLDEVQALAAERNMWLARFVAFLEHESRVVSRSYGQVQHVPLAALVPLLQGGG